MEEKGAVLVICREPRDLYLVDRFQRNEDRKVVVASEDMEVQQAAVAEPWVDEVCFIEQMESFYAVANDVLQILEAVNRWLKSLADKENGVPEELLFWVHHAEGGMTTQRIQDALLLIRSYQHLLKKYHVAHVILHRRIHYRWEDEVLIHTARSMGVSVKEIRPLMYRIGEKLGLMMVQRFLFGRLRRLYAPARLVYFWLRLKLYGSLLRATIDRRNRRPSPSDGMLEIVFQLGSSERKHVENIVPLMREFERRAGYWPVALCWQARGGAREIRREGLQADELERWFPLSRWPEVIRRAKWTWRRANGRKRNLYRAPAISYRGVPLGPLLWPSMEYFFQEAIVRRLALKISAENYFKEHHPAAIKLWGQGILEYGAVCHTIVQQAGNPLTFHYNLGIGVEWPYFQRRNKLYLAAGELEKGFLRRHGVPFEQIAVAGQGRYDHLAHFIKEHTPVNSRRQLNLPLDKEIYVFYAPTGILRGAISFREQFIVAEALIRFFKNHTKAVLIIKLHPSDNSGIIERLAKQYRSSNIFLIDKHALPYHCINAADIVVTKFSTVGVEAMLLDKPLISIVLDKESRWQDIYGNVAERFYSIQAMLSFLELLMENPEERQWWEEGQKQLRKSFLTKRFKKEGQSAAKMMGDAIDKRLRIQREDSAK